MIKGILFDKDGTLLDIEKTWVPVAKRVCQTLVNEFAPGVNPERLLEAIGIVRDEVLPTGSMAKGTNADIAHDLALALREAGVVVEQQRFALMSEECFTKFSSDVSIVPAIKQLPGLIDRLKNRGLCIGLATSDNVISARHCLDQLDILPYFDFIGADDGDMLPKPDIQMMNIFCERCALIPEEVVMVGDTMVDIAFGRESGAGLVIGIEKEHSDVGKAADISIRSIAELMDEQEKLIWEKS